MFTTHRVYGRSEASSEWTLLHELSGLTRDGQWLVAALDSGSPIRYVKVETIAGWDWVAWFEITLLASS